MQQAIQQVRIYLSANGLKFTRQRRVIIELFLKNRGHSDLEIFFRRVRKKNPRIGYTTVYRTLELLCQCGLAHKRRFGKGTAVYENAWNKGHHDHLICLSCGSIVEFEDDHIEHMQTEVAKRHHFVVVDHRLELYGQCRKCRNAGRPLNKGDDGDV